MLSNLITVSGQALILFLMMAIGYALYKTKLIDEGGIGGLTNVLLWAVTPCLLVETFSRQFDRQLAISLAVFALGAFIAMMLAALIGRLIYGRKPEAVSPIYRYSVMFSNCGFMGIPLAEALYGGEGVMYASIFVAVFNVVQWTYGFAMMSGKGISVKKLLINPGIIGLALGLPLFIFSVGLPHVPETVISSMASVNTPVAMVVIGCHLAKTNLFKALTDIRAFAVSAVRLMMIPAVILGLAWALPIPLSAVALSVLCIEIAAPVAATLVPMSSLCGRDTEMAGRCVAVSTLMSIITLPIVASVCGAIF